MLLEKCRNFVHWGSFLFLKYIPCFGLFGGLPMCYKTLRPWMCLVMSLDRNSLSIGIVIGSASTNGPYN